MQTQYAFSRLLIAGLCAATAVPLLAGEPRSSAKVEWINICPGCPNNPFGITEVGTISGTVITTEGKRGFLLSRKGEITWVDTPGNVFIELQRGNNLGQVTGVYYSLSDFKVHGFVRERDGTHRDISFGGAEVTVASSINDIGEVLASYSNSPVPFGYISYIERKGVVTEYITYPGADSTIALGFNLLGDIAGVFLLKGSLALHGFIRKKHGALIEVTFPEASEVYLSDINGFGIAVGFWRDKAGAFNGLVYQKGRCYTVGPGRSPSGYTNVTLTGINIQGHLVGVAFPEFPGDGDGFLMKGAFHGPNVVGFGPGTPCALPLEP